MDQTELLLEQLRPEIQLRGWYLVAIARYYGVPLVLTSALRTEEHNAAVGGVPGSLHLMGLAFDVGVQGYQWRTIPPEWWVGLGELGEALGLRWGGRFSTYDPIHFDLPAQFREGPGAI